MGTFTHSRSDFHKTNKFTKRIAGYRIPLKMLICLKWMQHIFDLQKSISPWISSSAKTKITANQLPWILADGRYNFGSCNCGRPCAFRSEECLRWEVGGADGWWWRELTADDLYIHPWKRTWNLTHDAWKMNLLPGYGLFSGANCWTAGV